MVTFNFSFANLMKDRTRICSVKSKFKLGLDIIILFFFENCSKLLIFSSNSIIVLSLLFTIAISSLI